MDMELFEGLGLSPNEAKMYLSLVEKGESSISQIALASGIHRRNAYDAIQRLIDKGLCFQIVSSKENTYNAVDPDKLVELLAEKRDRLETVLPELKRKFINRVAPEEAYIYRGLEGQKNLFRDIVRVGKESYFIGAKGGWSDPRLTPARTAFFKEANRKGIRFWGLYDYEAQAHPEFSEVFTTYGRYRFLPKEYSTNSGIQIFGDYVVNYTELLLGATSDKAVFFVMRSTTLAESYRIWFKYLWDKSTSTVHVRHQK